MSLVPIFSPRIYFATAIRNAVRLSPLAVMLVMNVHLDAQQPPRPADHAAGDEQSFAAFLAMVEEQPSEKADSPGGNTLPVPLSNSDSERGIGPTPRANSSNDSGEMFRAPEADPAPSQTPLSLADVMASVYRSYPDIERARQFLPQAGGELRSAYGEYDTKFQAGSLSEPTGFYRNYRNGLGLARQTWWGGYLSAGYRIGRGFYQPWYKERQTDDAGEVKLGLGQPLLQGRAIDPQRVAVFQASLRQQAAGPELQHMLLSVAREAMAAYWQWVSAGDVLQAQTELLELAEQRGGQFEAGVNAGKFAEVDLIFNRQLIAERRVAKLKAEQKFRTAGFKLGLYLRDAAGQSLPPDVGWRPTRFPTIQPPPPLDFNAELASALSRRPEPQLLQLERRHLHWDRRLASNEMLPRFDFVSEASQDIGPPATKSNDKGEFELVIGFQSEVPIQRSKARGKIQSTSAKMAQVDEKLRLVRDKIATDLQIGINKLQLAEQIAEQSRVSLTTALETLRRYEKGFEKGYIDLIYLNFLETKTNETEIKLIDAQRDWFIALGELQLALGLDPLDQAMLIAALPESELPGPGHLPDLPKPDDKAFEEDWRLHQPQPLPPQN